MIMKQTFVLLFFLSTVCTAGPAHAAIEFGFLDTLINFTNSTFGEYGCWSCPFFEVLFDAMNRLATNVSTKMSGTFLVLMGVGVLFLLAFKVGKAVVQLQEIDLAQFINDLIRPLGRAIVAAVLLTYSLSIFYYLISPALQLSLTLSSIIYTTGGSNEMSIVKAVNQESGGKVKLTVNCKDAAELANQTNAGQPQAFSAGVKEALMCNLKQVSASLVAGIATGMYTMLYGTRAGPFTLPSPFIMFQGIIFVLIYFSIMLTYPLKLIDPIFKIAFTVALAPLWIVLWVFPATTGYTKKAWDIFFSSCLTLLILSILVMFSLQILDTLSFSDTMWSHLFHNEPGAAFKEYPLGGFLLLNTMAFGFLCFKLIGRANPIAQTFGGANTDIGMSNTITSTVIQGAHTAVGAAKKTAAVGQAAAHKMNHWGKETGLEAARARGELPAKDFGHTDAPATDYFDKNNQLTAETTAQFNDGQPKTQTLHAPDGSVSGTRTYNPLKKDDYTQHNTDGTMDIKSGNDIRHFDKTGKLLYQQRITEKPDDKDPKKTVRATETFNHKNKTYTKKSETGIKDGNKIRPTEDAKHEFAFINKDGALYSKQTVKKPTKKEKKP